MTKQNLALIAFGAGLAVVIFLLGFIALALVSRPGAPPPSTAAPTDPPAATQTTPPSNYILPTVKPTPACYHWDQINESMIGQVVCVRGVIKTLAQTRKIGARYEFTDAPGAFFVFSVAYEVYDTLTGKTLAPGTCIQVTALVELQAGVLSMNLDNLVKGKRFNDLQSFDDPAVCN